MIADYLHDFYTMPINLVVGGVPTTATIRWYRAPAGAKPLPFASAIFSHVWDNNPGESIPGEIGEVGYPRTWDPGDNRGYQGKCYRGDPAWFLTGSLPPLAGLTPGACNCFVAAQLASGGFELSGQGQHSSAAPPVTLCSVCPGGSPMQWQVTLAGGTVDFAFFNGVYTISWTGIDCEWLLHQTSSPFRIITLYYLAPNWVLRLSADFNPTEVFYAPTGPFACMGTNHWTVTGAFGSGTAPTAVIAPI